jgi:hypothetical protein
VPREPLVLPDYGPTLPTLLRRRAGVPERVTIAVVVAAVVLLGIAMVAVRPGIEDAEQLVHEGQPVFNLLYPSGAVREVEPRPGELVRLEGERGRQSVAVTVRPLTLPVQRGDISHAQLPVYASTHADALRREYPGFTLLEEGRARINDAPGYEITFTAGRTHGSDVLLVPAEDDARGAVVLGLRRVVRGAAPLGEADHEFTRQARKAFRSFRYGRDRG